jgi:excisionase family DNA binding protein
MLPSFEIYLSILTDGLMPWLKENRRQEKFESVIRMAGTAFHGDYMAFFRAIGNTFKMFHFDIPKRINTELVLLETATLTPLGKRMIQTFVNQPVLNYREHYYNVLTGMSLGAYHDLPEQFLRQCEGPEIKAFYLEKLLADIHSMLLIPLPGKFEFPEEEKIAFRVKLALAILYRLLQKKQGKIENSMLLYFDARGWLKITLEQMESVGLKEELLKIYDRFAGEKKSPEQDMLPGAAEIEAALQEKVQDLNSRDLIPDALKELQQELSEIKQAFENYRGNKQIQNRNDDGSDKWLTGNEVCEILRISKSTLKRKRDSNELEFSRLGNKIRYEEKYIRQMMRESRDKGK